MTRAYQEDANPMVGCTGKNYVERKVNLMHQLGYYKVTLNDFVDCKTEIQIDRKARQIMGL